LSWQKSGIFTILLALICLFLFDNQAIANFFGKCDLDRGRTWIVYLQNLTIIAIDNSLFLTDSSIDLTVGYRHKSIIDPVDEYPKCLGENAMEK
jgi:hypothetical protein